MWHGMEGIGWGWLGLGILHVVVFWGVVILVFAALLRWLGTTSALLVGAGASPAA